MGFVQEEVSLQPTCGVRAHCYGEAGRIAQVHSSEDGAAPGEEGVSTADESKDGAVIKSKKDDEEEESIKAVSTKSGVERSARRGRCTRERSGYSATGAAVGPMWA